MLNRAATFDEKRLLTRARTAWFHPILPNGNVQHRGLHPGGFDRDQLAIGTKIELEHTSNPAVALEIAMAHLDEDRRYYEKLERMERGELGAATNGVGHVVMIVGGGFMLVDAVLSGMYVGDQRPLVQAGRAARGVIGLALLLAGIARV